ncbi:MAG: hypothetical protein JWR66_2721, partial [Modestobacter sp.]|nr:hypothetical protein [Modestobacter sp.]
MVVIRIGDDHQPVVISERSAAGTAAAATGAARRLAGPCGQLG